MATRILTTSNEWQELANGDCLVQNLNNGDLYIKYADGLPSSGFNSSFRITSTSILNFPAPLTGSIYVATKASGKVAVEDV